MILLIYLILLLSILYILYVKTSHTRKLLSSFPGDIAFPLIGNAYQFGSKASAIHNYLMDMAKKYNYDAFKVYLGPQLLLFLNEPEDVKALLTNPNCMNKVAEYSFLQPWLGEGVLFTKGSKWINTRRILTPTFSNKVLDTFLPIFEKNTNLLITKLSEVADGKIHDVHEFISLFTLDIISEVGTGKSLNAQEFSGNEIVTSYITLCNIFIVRLFSSWKRYDFLFKLTKDYRVQTKLAKIVRGYIIHIITQRRNRLIGENISTKLMKDGGGKVKSQFLDMLLMSTIDGSPLTNEEITNEVCTMLFAGHDTVTSALCHSLYELSQNVDVQEKLFNEQSALFLSKSESSGFQIFNEMSYLDLFIKEVLRLYPSGPLFGRYVEKDTKIKCLQTQVYCIILSIDGRTIPAGSSVMMYVSAMHRNPKYFKDPEKFNPERFLPENRLNKHAYEYIPFSGGPRNCLGMRYANREIKYVLSKIIRNFQFFSAGPDVAPISYTAVTLKSENGFHLILKRRK